MLNSKEILMRATALAAIVGGILVLPATAEAQSGSARAALVAAAGVNTTIGAATLPSGGGIETSDVDAVGLAGLLGATWGSAVTSGVSSTERLGVQSVASLADVNVLAGKVKAKSVIAVARLVVNGGSVLAADGMGSSIGELVINGVAYNADNMQENTRINLPGTGYVVIKEVITGAASVTVNMIHVVLTAPFTGIKIGEIVIGSASCGS